MDELPKRKQIRLKDYDYSQNGYYFITICTEGRQTILSDVRRGGVLLRPIGKIVENEIRELTQQYKIEINPYIIMPDHVHMIIKINREIQRAEQSPAPTVCDMICAFKSLTTKIANKMDNCIGRKIWQRNYYEHIIRDENDYITKTEYILNNPLKWELEKNNKMNELPQSRGGVLLRPFGKIVEYNGQSEIQRAEQSEIQRAEQSPAPTCIDMELRNGYFNVRRGDSFNLENDNVPVLSYVEKGVWHIVSDPNPQAKGYFTLYLPHDFTPYKLKVKAFNSTLKIAPLNAVDVEIENNNSDISIGHMNMRNIYINIGNGRLYAEIAPDMSAYINCGFGDVTLMMPGTINDYRIRARHGNGSVILDGIKRPREYDNSVQSDSELVIKCGFGKVDVNFNGDSYCK